MKSLAELSVRERQELVLLLRLGIPLEWSAPTERIGWTELTQVTPKMFILKVSSEDAIIYVRRKS